MTDVIVDLPVADEGPDLGVFDREMPWSERHELIKRTFPSVVSLDWNKVFIQDPGMFGRIMNDILKADQAVPGRPGKRPALDMDEAKRRWREIIGDDSVDYTMLPFHRAFQNLVGDKYSIRHLARKCNLDKSMIHNLLRGEKDPTPEIMEKIAVGFKISPSYFLEYRVAYVLGVMFYKLTSMPESSVVFYNKIRGGENGDS